MAVSKDAKTRKKSKRKGKVLSAEEAQAKRRELVERAADLVIEVHRDALKELARH